MSGWIAQLDLPLVFAALMGFAVLVYVITDGYDLGVGLSVPFLPRSERLAAMRTIGPFWDANTTWLVLGVGILLAAFPKAHSAILQALYLPVLAMLVGLVFRAFFYEMALKFPQREHLFVPAFFAGSLMAAFSQGVMIAQFAAGFESNLFFSTVVGGSVCLAYLWLGALWLNATLSSKPREVSRLIGWGLAGTLLALVLVSVLSPLYIEQVYERWFGEAGESGLPKILYLWPYPAMSLFFLFMSQSLKRKHPWKAFGCALVLFCLCFFGLAYGIFPYIAPNNLTIYQAAASAATLQTILYGFVLIMPFILAYTAWSHYIFLKRITHNG